MGRWEQVAVLLQVLLPFLVSCGEYLLLQLLAAPAVAGITIAGFALVQVRRSKTISLGHIASTTQFGTAVPAQLHSSGESTLCIVGWSLPGMLAA